MYCPKCGAQMSDNGLFCPKCGANVQTQQPAQQQNGWQQPTQPQQGGWQQPTQQQNGWQQPQQGGWQQPAQQQNGWQQPTPQQGGWQQPAQQPNGWQQPAQQQNGWQQPQQGGWQQPNAWQPQGAPVRAAKKFSFLKLLIALVVVAGGVFAAVKFTPLKAVYMNRFAPAKDYYRYVEKDSVQDLATSVSTVYDNLIASNVSDEERGMSGKLTIELGDEARRLVREFAGAYLDQINPGEDLSWLKTLDLTYGFSRDGKLIGLDGSVNLNAKSLISLTGVVERESGKIYLSVPELSDRYIETSLSELGLEDLDLSGMGYGFRSAMRTIGSMDPNELSPILDALPEPEVTERLIKTYLTAVLECIDDVEKSKSTLSVGDVSEDYTVLTTTIDGEAMERIVKKIGPMLKDDADVKDLVLKMAEAAEEDGQQTYDEFVRSIDQMLDNADTISDDNNNTIVMSVFTDSKGKVHGRSIETGTSRIEILMPEKNGKFALRYGVIENGTEQMTLVGGGTRSGDKLTGSMDLEVMGQYVGKVGLDGFDDQKLREGYLVGAVTISPSSELWRSASGMPASVAGIMENIALRFDMDSSKDKVYSAMSLLSNDRLLISIAFENTVTAGGSVRSVGSGVAMQDWVQTEITLDKLKKIVRSLESAGVPEVYVGLLDGALSSAFPR